MDKGILRWQGRKGTGTMVVVLLSYTVVSSQSTK